MTTATNLTNHFLIAMPTMGDPNFAQAVALICDHSEQGALGVVLNRPLQVQLAELLEHLELAYATADFSAIPVFNGGPVAVERGFILHDAGPRWESSLSISDQLTLTMSRDILAAIASGEGPSRYLVLLGYAGWGPGQLEQEIADNAWLTCPAEASIIFQRSPATRWKAAAQLLGIDLDLFAADAGHA